MKNSRIKSNHSFSLFLSFYKISSLMTTFYYLLLMHPCQREWQRLWDCVQRLINMDSIFYKHRFPSRKIITQLHCVTCNFCLSGHWPYSLLQLSSDSKLLTMLWAESPQQSPLLWGKETTGLVTLTQLLPSMTSSGLLLKLWSEEFNWFRKNQKQPGEEITSLTTLSLWLRMLQEAEGVWFVWVGS